MRFMGDDTEKTNTTHDRNTIAKTNSRQIRIIVFIYHYVSPKSILLLRSLLLKWRTHTTLHIIMYTWLARCKRKKKSNIIYIILGCVFAYGLHLGRQQQRFLNKTRKKYIYIYEI